MMADFIASMYSQSMYFYGKIASMSYLCTTFGDDPIRLQTEMKSCLEMYFKNAFTVVVIDTDHTYINVNGKESGEYILSIGINLIDDEGRRINLAREFSVLNGRFKEMMDIANNPREGEDGYEE